jgi:predicted nucleotidyltransferase
MSKTLPIQLPHTQIVEFCQRNHIRKLSLFGSILRDDFGSNSDVDFLVEFEPDYIPGLIRLAGMELELSEIIGRKADLRTPGDLSRYFRQKVLDSAIVQYVKD